ncbi:hypothetical protein CRUP_037571 [Coryphaenoides rupestris]|nr:hypothetical protein CRUP_037571 [Coryphaenoides rupestris]
MRANPPLIVSWLYNGSLLVQATGSGIVVTNDGLTTRLTVAEADRDLHGGTYQ